VIASVMLSYFRRVLEVLQEIGEAVRELGVKLDGPRTDQVDTAALSDRLGGLELSRAKWQAEMEALVLVAQGKFRSASNAEARERTMKESYEKQPDLGYEDGEGIEPGGSEDVLPINAEIGGPDEVHALPMGMAPTRKAAALNMKYGL